MFQGKQTQTEVLIMKTMKFVVTCGMFDGTTKKLEHDVSDVHAMVNNYIAQRFDGCSIFDCDGVYRHIDGTTVREPSIRCEFIYTEKEKVLDFCKWYKKVMNQESVMFEAIEEDVEFI